MGNIARKLSIIVAVFGAVVLLFVLRLIKRTV